MSSSAVTTRGTERMKRARGLAISLAGALALAGCPGSDAPPVPEPDITEGSAEAPTVTALSEQEPNDAAQDAMRLTSERPVSGEALAGDVDRFLVAPAAGNAELIVEATAPGRLEVRRQQDGVATNFELSAGEQRVGPFSRESSLLVSVDAAGIYTLALNDTAETRCGFGHEPDSATAPGVAIGSVPASVQGCITAVDDVDVFAVSAEALAGVNGMGIEVSGVENVSFMARVETEAGTLLTELAGGPGETLRLPNLSAPAHGGARIILSSLSGANEVTPYRLDLRRLPPLNGTIELEPNDDALLATPVEQIHLINGYLHRPGDRDMYRILVEEPTHVRMMIDAPADVDLQLEIPGGPLGTLIIDDAGPGEQERVCSLRLEPGDEGTLLSVFARSVGAANLEPYLVQFQILDAEEWEEEPNDQLADVLGVLPRRTMRGDGPPVGLWRSAEELGAAVSGYAFPPGDVDRFVVEVFGDPRAAATYTSVTMRLEPNGQADYSLEVLDEDGAAVAMANAGGIAELESVRLDLPAGRYVARVKLEDGDGCGLPYNLSVLQTALPGSSDAPAEPSEEVDGETPLDVMGRRVAEVGEPSGQRGMTREEAAEAAEAEGSSDRPVEDIDRARLRRRLPNHDLPSFEPPGQ